MKHIKPSFEFMQYMDYDSSNWMSHKYFAYDLVLWLKPSLIVELGTYNGIPLFCFSQAVKDNNLKTRLCGVGPDETAGEQYARTVNESPETFEKVRKSFYVCLDIRMLRKSCDKALSEFGDCSVDILNFTGMDKDNEIKKHFEQWKDKVKHEGMILVHNINNKNEYPGISEFWSDLKEGYKTIEFKHGNGLGIVFLADTLYEKMLPYRELWQKYYSTLEYNEKLTQLCELKESEIKELENQITEFKLKQSNSVNLELGFLGGAARLKRIYNDLTLGIKLLLREGIKIFVYRAYWYLKDKRVVLKTTEDSNSLRKPEISNRNKADTNPDTKNSAAVCLIVKNEAPYLIEWMAYYLVLGFDRLLIYDNDSTDNTRDIIDNVKLCDDRIEYIPWPDVDGYSPQFTAYNDVISRADTEWVAFFDIDEYLVLKEHRNIHEFLSSFNDNTSAIAINWRIFGSSGNEHYSDDLVIRRFTRCSNPKYINNCLFKTIARRKEVKHMEIHCAELIDGNYVDPSGKPVVLLGCVFTPVVSHKVAQLNHYVLKSREEYNNKQKRGEASYPPNSKERFGKFNDNFWTEHDRNEHSDHSINVMIGPTLEMMDKLRRINGQ